MFSLSLSKKVASGQSFSVARHRNSGLFILELFRPLTPVCTSEYSQICEMKNKSARLAELY